MTQQYYSEQHGSSETLRVNERDLSREPQDLGESMRYGLFDTGTVIDSCLQVVNALEARSAAQARAETDALLERSLADTAPAEIDTASMALDDIRARLTELHR